MGFWSSIGIVVAMLLVATGAAIAAWRARQAQRRAEVALEAALQAAEEIQQALKARTAMLGMVSHELRTPLSKVLAATELIEMVAGGAAVKEATAELYAAAETMTRQLNDLGAYSELSYPRAGERGPDLDIRETLFAVARTQEPMARARGNEVSVDVASDVPYRIALDAIRVEQIATNLISNAVKYTREGRIDVAVRLAGDEPNTLELVVADTGKGIAPAEQACVWEPFYRAQRGGEPGSGLGLAIVRLAVTKLGGAVMLESALGAGATFTVRLPLSA